MPNRLINSTSPYLLQHSHNPVDWFPWGAEALHKAMTENKPIIVSIGYSACHWCHVMERECFENETLAAVMNQYFICIKVDREERPDIDQIYMDAIQNMGIRGGWPLNVFLTSEAKPFYGGTYFPPQQWHSILGQVHNAYVNHKDQIEESAEGFVRSLNRSELEKMNLASADMNFTSSDLTKALEAISKNFDHLRGGMKKAPKFPMPSIYTFLLRIWQSTCQQPALDHAILTLQCMALGGIYDQVGGGFSRYSTDTDWFLPHFEKMLYDNGQLISLYTEAYLATQQPLFKQIILETIGFVARELTSHEGGFYSALDADSEGEEGKFYVWTKEEIESLYNDHHDHISNYFNITEVGNWEHLQNILCCNTTIEEYAQLQQLEPVTFKNNVLAFKSALLQQRNNRIRPGLDDKILASWNGLMLNGLVDAYRALDDNTILDLALKNADYIVKYLIVDADQSSAIWHTHKNGEKIVGFLEDYVFVIQAFINLYEATFDEQWIYRANALTKYVLAHFIDEQEEFFYFTDAKAEKLIARKKEIFDNVIPSSNSAMAINLYKLGAILDIDFYKELSQAFVGKIKPIILADPQYLSNWGILLSYLAGSFKEIVISGPLCLQWRAEIDKIYYPGKIMVGAVSNSQLSLLKGRESDGNHTLIYVCENKTCQLPAKSVKEALSLLL